MLIMIWVSGWPAVGWVDLALFSIFMHLKKCGFPLPRGTSNNYQLFKPKNRPTLYPAEVVGGGKDSCEQFAITQSSSPSRTNSTII